MSDNMLVGLMADIKQQQKNIEMFEQAAEKNINKAIMAIPENVDLAVNAAILSLSIKVTEKINECVSVKINNYLQKLDIYNANIDNKLTKIHNIDELIKETISIIKPTAIKKGIFLIITSILIACLPLAVSIFFNNKLIDLKQQVNTEQATLEILRDKTWKLELLAQNGQRWIILPKGAKFMSRPITDSSRGQMAIQISD